MGIEQKPLSEYQFIPYASIMFDSWKFSKGILLTSLVTGTSWLLLLAFAYRQHRSSEMLSGVIAGLTVILGILTAEWLRAARDQVELTRIRFFDLVSHLERFLYNFEEFMQDQFSHDQNRYTDDFVHVSSSVTLLSLTTRWPQPNAKKIREAGLHLMNKIVALQMDADENGFIWSLEDRMQIAFDLGTLAPLIWAGSPEKSEVNLENVRRYRKSPRNEGMPDAWTRTRPT